VLIEEEEDQLGAAPPLMSVTNVSLSYGTTTALNGVSLHLPPGEILAMTGRSGSGKSSLLYCMAGILRPTEGDVFYGGTSLNELDDDALSSLRRTEFGFVFQFGELVPELSLWENISLPLALNKVGRKERHEKVTAIAERLGIAGCAGKRPGEVSGGQAQRAAVARALVHSPNIVFADEPTGSLDSENSEAVLQEFIFLARGTGAAVVLVTHEPAVASICDRRIELVDGSVRTPIHTDS
jgi:putative ABC transport system ATP-binding protein